MLPLAYVRVATVGALPYPMTMLQALIPLTIINLPIGPLIHSSTMSFTTLEPTKVGVLVGVPFKALSITQVVEPMPFVLPLPILVTHYPKAMSYQFIRKFLQCSHLSDVHSRFVAVVVSDSEPRESLQNGEINLRILYVQVDFL